MKSSLTLSVIIVTKNRSRLLARALTALVGQCKAGDEVIVVDASTDDTPAVIRSFSDRLPLRYYRFVTPGYPLFYNYGARKARGDILVFYTDDCTASPTFLRQIRRAHRKHPHAVIQGYTYSIPRGNLYADIMGDHYRNWLASMSLSGGEMKAYDSKNASIPRRLFWKNGGLSANMLKGSEDIEFGIRLRRHGIKIFFDPTIIASHHERTTLKGFLLQHYRFAVSEGHLDRILPKAERLGIIPGKKLILHIQSFGHREWAYIKKGKLREACLIPFLYGILVCIRVWGYATAR